MRTRNFHKHKNMVIIFWNIALLKILPPGEYINSTTFIEKVLDPLTGYPTFVEAKKSWKKFYLHFDNAKPHKAKCASDYMQLKKFTNPPHHAYSPDLEPSDFYLFGKLKDKFEGTRFENDEELEDAIKEEFR